jgi:hypothetical protein
LFKAYFAGNTSVALHWRISSPLQNDAPDKVDVVARRFFTAWRVRDVTPTSVGARPAASSL